MSRYTSWESPSQSNLSSSKPGATRNPKLARVQGRAVPNAPWGTSGSLGEHYGVWGRLNLPTGPPSLKDSISKGLQKAGTESLYSSRQKVRTGPSSTWNKEATEQRSIHPATAMGSDLLEFWSFGSLKHGTVALKAPLLTPFYPARELREGSPARGLDLGLRETQRDSAIFQGIVFLCIGIFHVISYHIISYHHISYPPYIIEQHIPYLIASH